MTFMPPGVPGSAVPLPPPPAFIPPKPNVSYIVDCLQHITYVWLWNGDSFWYYPMSLESGAVTGYRWTGFSWTFYGFDPQLINASSCPPIPTLF